MPVIIAPEKLLAPVVASLVASSGKYHEWARYELAFWFVAVLGFLDAEDSRVIEYKPCGLFRRDRSATSHRPFCVT
jgi:hypothetical protein